VSKMPKTKGRQTTVKIPEGLLETVGKFVDSPKAKALGLDSKYLDRRSYLTRNSRLAVLPDHAERET